MHINKIISKSQSLPSSIVTPTRQFMLIHFWGYAALFNFRFDRIALQRFPNMQRNQHDNLNLRPKLKFQKHYKTISIYYDNVLTTWCLSQQFLINKEWNMWNFWLSSTYRSWPYSSRYEFNKNEISWTASKEACESKNGMLVAMETKAEWEFVNKQIQRMTKPTEWYIGLKKEYNEWKWMNGKYLKFNDKNIPISKGCLMM